MTPTVQCIYMYIHVLIHIRVRVYSLLCVFYSLVRCASFQDQRQITVPATKKSQQKVKDRVYLLTLRINGILQDVHVPIMVWTIVTFFVTHTAN